MYDMNCVVKYQYYTDYSIFILNFTHTEFLLGITLTYVCYRISAVYNTHKYMLQYVWVDMGVMILSEQFQLRIHKSP